MQMQRVLVVGYVAVVAASLWLRSAVPVWAIVGPHDDFLFVRLAYHLGAGLWLGPFDNVTLAKGMGYPAFILAAFLAGVPLKIAEHGIYLAAAGLAAWLLLRLTDRRWLAFAAFALLALNPVMLRPELARVIRENLYIGLSLAVLGLAGIVLLQRRPAPQSSVVRALLLIALGLVGALYWLTREEGVWLGPALAVLLMGSAIIAWRERNPMDGARAHTVLRAGGAGVLVLAAFAAPLGAVAAMNYRHYGAAVLTEFQAGRFLAAYGSLLRIRHEHWQRHVLFPPDARAKAYAVSAAARELQPTLDGAVGDAWRRTSCRDTGVSPCPDIYGVWMVWAVRDAVAQAGHYRSARDALNFYDRIAREIGEACDDGRLTCESAGLSIFPPFRWSYVMDALARGPAAARVLTEFGNGEVGTRPNVGPDYYLAFMADLVGPVATFRPARIALYGTMTVKGELPKVFVHDRSGEPHTTTVKWVPADPDAAQPPPGRRIDIESDCIRPACELVVQTDAARRVIVLPDAVEREVLASPEFELTIDHVRKYVASSAPPATEKRRDLQLAIAHAVGRIYAATMPVLSVLALIGVLTAALVRPADPALSSVLTLALAAAAAVTSRAALLAYHEVTALPGAVNLLYLSPATPFLLIFVTLGLYLGGQSVLASYAARRRKN
jgi:hypothetical protein